MPAPAPQCRRAVPCTTPHLRYERLRAGFSFQTPHQQEVSHIQANAQEPPAAAGERPDAEARGGRAVRGAGERARARAERAVSVSVPRQREPQENVINADRAPSSTQQRPNNTGVTKKNAIQSTQPRLPDEAPQPQACDGLFGGHAAHDPARAEESDEGRHAPLRPAGVLSSEPGRDRRQSGKADQRRGVATCHSIRPCRGARATYVVQMSRMFLFSPMA
jgi:hypothetical protein